MLGFRTLMLGRVDFFVDSWHIIRLFENVKSTCKCDLLFPAGSEKLKRVKYLHEATYSYRKKGMENFTTWSLI